MFGSVLLGPTEMETLTLRKQFTVVFYLPSQINAGNDFHVKNSLNYPPVRYVTAPTPCLKKAVSPRTSYLFSPSRTRAVGYLYPDDILCR